MDTRSRGVSNILWDWLSTHSIRWSVWNLWNRFESPLSPGSQRKFAEIWTEGELVGCQCGINPIPQCVIWFRDQHHGLHRLSGWTAGLSGNIEGVETWKGDCNGWYQLSTWWEQRWHTSHNAWKAGGDIIRDIPEMSTKFGFEFIDKEVGGFGSVHLYVAKKPVGGEV